MQILSYFVIIYDVLSTSYDILHVPKYSIRSAHSSWLLTYSYALIYNSD